jgi:hypothetical protein
MSLINNMEDLKDTVRHFLMTDMLTRENDLYLILRVCERRGYCTKVRRFNEQYVYVFDERKVLTNSIPRSFFDTVRRTRQKLQEENSDLRPVSGVYEARQAASLDARTRIKEVSL